VKKTHLAASTHKKVVVLLFDGGEPLRGYLNPKAMVPDERIDVLTTDGQHQSAPLEDVKAVYFVRELSESFELERKTFLSRPKLDGLWVRLRFRDEDVLEGIVRNDLLDLLDAGINLTPPDLHGNVVRMFVPRSSLAELTVLGVVGAARRSPRATGPREADGAQTKLFS